MRSYQRIGLLLTALLAPCVHAQTAAPGTNAEKPGAIVLDGAPPVPLALANSTRPYLEFRQAVFQSWNAEDRSIVVLTRFGNTPQIHSVRAPAAARTQLSFEADRIGSATWAPGRGDVLVVQKDTGGGEFFQLYTLKDGNLTLLTDGKSRNLFDAWAHDGSVIGYSSTRRNGEDTDLYVMDPRNPATDRRVAELSGGGWSIGSFAPDGAHAAVIEYVLPTKSNLHLLDLGSGQLRALGDHSQEIAYGGATFAADGTLWVTSNEGAEFQRLGTVDLDTGKFTPRAREERWDVEAFDIAADGSFVAYQTNEAGASRLKLLDPRTNEVRTVEGFPDGRMTGLSIAPWGDIGLSFTAARSAGDAYSVDPRTLAVTRWTTSETGGLDLQANVEPELLEVKSFDGTALSGFLYRPSAAKFRGKRPLIVQIHGGPASQSRPIFLGRDNYLLNELGVAIFLPNVRGSTGYGKTFVSLDDGPDRRENSVRDIGAFLDRLASDSALDAERFAVTGGSYGGYMCYASAIRYGARLNAALCVVAISNWVTFLQNTESYRRDLRRVEYGDERDPEQHAKLMAISPLTSVAKLNIPLMVVTGGNDPRVPPSEAAQMVSAVRKQGGLVWHVLAEDEGHGFAKKANQDYQFWTSLLFWKETLLR
jgi:dipeptidyl aminopeptidase/acylaminoacyl peptidase